VEVVLSETAASLSHSDAVFGRFHARHNIEIPRLEIRVVPISNALRAKTIYAKITTCTFDLSMSALPGEAVDSGRYHG